MALGFATTAGEPLHSRNLAGGPVYPGLVFRSRGKPGRDNPSILDRFAAIGLVLVVIDVFSVMAYSVSLQRHEIGVCMALVAHRLG